jgi:hypothetical protein
MLPQWQIRYHVKRVKDKVIPDPEIGFLLPPNQHEVIQTQDFTYIKETDSHGFPNKGPWPVQADIVFLGDSLIMAEGVGIGKGFVSAIAQKLPGQSVVNLGMPAAGPERQYKIYQRFGVGLHPRLIVTCWYIASDLYNDFYFHSWLKEAPEKDYNHFRLTSSQKMKTRQAVSKFSSFDIFFEKSWLYGMGKELVLSWLGQREKTPDIFRFTDGTEILFSRQTLAFATQRFDVDNMLIDSLFVSLNKLQTVVSRHNATLVVLLLPSKEELFGSGVELGRESAIARVRERLLAMKTSMLDLYPAIREGGILYTPYFGRDIHFNEHGNQIIAEQFLIWLHTQN